MTFRQYEPTELLKPFVKAYRIIESQCELINRMLPSTSFAIAFRYKGQNNYLSGDKKVLLPASTISGLRRSVRLINYVKDTATIVILFKEAGAAVFFKEPLFELFEKSMPLENFIPQHTVATIEEQLAEAKNNQQRIDIIESFLLSQLYNHKPDKLISAVVDKIYFTKGFIRIKELTDTFSISTDAFEKRFRKLVGASPKQFSSIVRMKSIVNDGQKNKQLTDIAFDAGYFDQSHFNKDFKLFTGQTPTDFFQSPSFW